jgi:hypothetical protein
MEQGQRGSSLSIAKVPHFDGMINERGGPIWQRMLATRACFASPCRRVFGGSSREETMTSAMTAVGMAIGGTAPICYLPLSRPQHRRADRGSSGDSGGSYSGGDGSVAAIPDPIIPAVRVTPAELTAAAIAGGD